MRPDGERCLSLSGRLRGEVLGSTSGDPGEEFGHACCRMFQPVSDLDDLVPSRDRLGDHEIEEQCDRYNAYKLLNTHEMPLAVVGNGIFVKFLVHMYSAHKPDKRHLIIICWLWQVGVQ